MTQSSQDGAEPTAAPADPPSEPAGYPEPMPAPAGAPPDMLADPPFAVPATAMPPVPPAAPVSWPGHTPASGPGYVPGYAPVSGPGYAPVSGPGYPGTSYGYPPPYPYPAPPGPGTWPPAAPRRRTGRTVAIVAGVVAAVLVVCGGLTFGLVVALRTRADPVAADTAPSQDTATHSADLTSYLMPPPTNSRPWRSKPSTETYDLQQLAALSSDPTGRTEQLQQYGFERAAVGRWISVADSFVELRLYQFDSVIDAVGFYYDDVRGNSDGSWGPAQSFDAVPGAVSFQKSELDSDGLASSLSMGQRGDIVIVVFAIQHPPADLTESRDALIAQYARL